MPQKSSSARQYLVVISLVMLTTIGLLILRDILTLANFALIYLLVVLLIAVRAGIGPLSLGDHAHGQFFGLHGLPTSISEEGVYCQSAGARRAKRGVILVL